MNEKLQMKLCGDLVLREKCAAVDVVSPEILAAMDEMLCMMDEQKGVGIAAPQVGIAQRFLVMMDPDSKTIYKMINPCVISKSDKLKVMEEGCLSVVDKNDTPIFADVARPESITLEWTDEFGKKNTAQMSGYPARIAQHEIDHLDGVLFIDYLSPVKREMVVRKTKKRK
jgi:peptide deformylase